ncbi:MAG: hypothetical protein OJF48_001741 [Afipia sp.]|nr:MAG: hypothetical protein OJF48_001741 [Afipia sp.]
MSRYPDDILRIESADLDLAGDEIKHLPIYAGVRVAGRSPVEKRGDRLAVTLAAFGTRRKHTIRARRVTFATGAAYCLDCQKCKKPRKRLFLVETTTVPIEFSFRCKECTSIGDPS